MSTVNERPADYCPTCGRPFGKLNPAAVVAIRADSRSGSKIAKDYDVTKTTINLIKRGITWKHV